MNEECEHMKEGIIKMDRVWVLRLSDDGIASVLIQCPICKSINIEKMDISDICGK